MNTFQMIKAILVLTIIGFIAAFSLSFMNKLTSEPIAKQDQEKKLLSLSLVLPSYTIQKENTVTIDGQPFTYWEASKEENSVIKKAYAFITEEKGYGGTIQSIVGIDDTGKILGFTILSQSETPGLGARCTEITSNETFFDHFFKSNITNTEAIQWFQVQFQGLDTNKPINILKKGDWNNTIKDALLQQNAITAITGATITTKAVTLSIEKGAQKLKKALTLHEVKQ
ncbi:MAG TPA: FMN-binding protein [Spirochaetota bacterium]|nr:FMN-binding protein [Spirochaetota bacterium]HOT19406.1 FMN-binding protein [Spirochaetota bacterium]HPD04723.1 FMN-binding protein [Spirochaetota bacterium]HQK06516.1 FMN-binding protein [Spirochaetota bacterium]HRV14592.1 FMN-binding protein [Spirochaetota bacterium]